MKRELERSGDENRRLRSMLDEVKRNYSVLHKQLLLFMQQEAREVRQRIRVLNYTVVCYYDFLN